jgi:hypothetical protein
MLGVLTYKKLEKSIVKVSNEEKKEKRYFFAVPKSSSHAKN